MFYYKETPSLHQNTKKFFEANLVTAFSLFKEDDLTKYIEEKTQSTL